MNNNRFTNTTPAFELAIAVGENSSITFFPGINNFEALYNYHKRKPTWLFGHLSYSLQVETHQIAINKKPYIDFSLGYFFEPEILLFVKNGYLEIWADDESADNIYNDIASQHGTLTPAEKFSCNIETESKELYVEKIEAIRNHIKLGDCYELNFCRFFTAEEASINPYEVYNNLTVISPAPFAALYKLNGKYCICASPERYIQKKGRKIISQPIKGTSKRDVHNLQADEALKQALSNSPKERSENVMITDLVRNDLSRIAEKNSVKVDELFGIYTFPQVHQMISTISATLAANKTFADVLATSFPMGSMTGAPKKRVLELIAAYEQYDRGLFSGSIGYITPEADFDFNVIIRSLFYDEVVKNLFFAAGGAITFYSEAEKEYDETNLKTAAIRRALHLD